MLTYPANIAFSGGASSESLSAITFSNASGVSFGLSAGTMTATVQTNYLASNQGSNFVAASAAFAGTNASGTIASNGISVSVGNYLTTAMASGASTQFVQANATIAGTSISGTIASNGISLSVGPYLTTAALSGDTSKYAGVGETTATVAGTNLGLTVNTAGVNIAYPNWLTAAAPSPVNFSAGTTSSDLGSVVFSDSNKVSFGLSGSTITASVPLLNVTLGGNTAGTMAAVSTGTLTSAGGINITLSQSGNAISINGPAPYVRFYEPYSQTNTAGLALTAGKWYLAPFVAPQSMSGGRINFLMINTSTAGIVRDITATAFASSSSGTNEQSATISFAAALFSQGTGANSTRLESFWSNSFSVGLSQRVNLSVTGGNNSVSVSISKSMSYISDIGSDGAYTLNQFASNSSTGYTATSMNRTVLESIGASIRNVLSDSILMPIGLNTSLTPGAYWMGLAWSTTTASAATGGLGASALIFSHISMVGVSRLLLDGSFRNFGSSVTTDRSHLMPYGIFTGGANMAPPVTLALSSDLSSLGSQWIPYFNFVHQALTK